jgi:hypothetical protein
MRLDLDGKSVAVGVFSGAALVAALGAVQNGEPPVGRYRIEAAGNGRGSVDAFVLDTATGQVWRHTRAEFFNPKIGNVQ